MTVPSLRSCLWLVVFLPVVAMHQSLAQPLGPPIPTELPRRFHAAGKGDVEEGWRRYRQTLAWRQAESIDTILREPNEAFLLIKRHYPHAFHGRGKRGEPCYYERPGMANLQALKQGGVTLDRLLRHYVFVVEFQWQVLQPSDDSQSIYVIDLQGIRFGDFVGDVKTFVQAASKLSAQHYPERAGYVFVVNVPVWFKLLWSAVRPLVDEATLHKIHVLGGKDEIEQRLRERIDLDQIPREYGGTGPPLGHSAEEHRLAQWVAHNNAWARGQPTCLGIEGTPPCEICHWRPARSY